MLAKLRIAGAKLDTYPDIAKVELAAMFHEIAEQYSSGRLWSLLPASDLVGVKPARTVEPARLAVPAVVLPALLRVTGAVLGGGQPPLAGVPCPVRARGAGGPTEGSRHRTWR